MKAIPPERRVPWGWPRCPCSVCFRLRSAVDGLRSSRDSGPMSLIVVLFEALAVLPPVVDWEALLEPPLEEVRRRLQVGAPIAYEQRRTAAGEAAAAAANA